MGAFSRTSKCSGGPIQELSDGKTETESFVNHTHVLDEFGNRATSERRDTSSKDLDVVEETYDVNHPDFAYACEVGKQMARMWAMKLKADFPRDRFRVYYTQYDNPIVRFHKVRENEPVWLSDQQLKVCNRPQLQRCRSIRHRSNRYAGYEKQDSSQLSRTAAVIRRFHSSARKSR